MVTKIRPGATHYLAGIVRGGSGECEHCGRALKHLFRITDAAGVTMTVGRTHAAAFTGWTPSVAQAEGAQRVADRNAAFAAYLTRSAIGRELDAAADTEIATNKAMFDAYEAELGRPVERSGGRSILQTARIDVGENLLSGRWDDAQCDEWARTGINAGIRYAL